MIEVQGTGEWVWAAPLGTAVQVQSTRTLWGTTTLVAIDGEGHVHERTLETHRLRCDEDERRHTDSIRTRRNAIQAVGLAEVRQHRLKKLEAEHEAWKVRHEKRKRAHPILEPVLFLSVRGGPP